MPEIPECLNRRYLALDELIKDLTSTMSNRSSNADCPCESTTDVGIKLMCDFWNILKEDPNCDLTQAVQQRMGLNAKSNNLYGHWNATCYMAGPGSSDDDDDKKRCAFNKIKNLRCRSPEPESKPKCCTSKLVSSSVGSNVLPLSKVLCNLKEAASFDKKCNVQLNKLMETGKQLQDQIQNLEHRENEGIQLIKQADCMWSCMENVYKKKITESLERQKVLLKQLKEVEASTTKWRKNKKDLEFQISNINKCQQEITEKINQKSNDLKFIDMEITEFNKRIENNKKEIETAKKSLTNKKQASDLKIATITANITELQKKLSDEQKHKYEKEQEGNKYIKEAREDLQTICRVLLQKKLENEDKKAEREAILLELDMLKQTCDVCREKCQNKHIFINEEIKNIDKEIAEFKVKCIRCHECTDTADVRKFCTDCPRCLEERDCLYTDGHCDPNHSMDCVCMSIKQKFLDNIFDNMYTVLEKQAQTDPGKAVADAVLRCLKRSRNGKLNDETKKILQDFILTTVKKNLNLTIVGGAVKTRCEMDPETYKKLMLCLKQVKVTQPPKVDAGTAAKKDPCRRWGGTSECNCPKGPDACICTKNAPPPSDDPTPCSPQDKEDISEVVACPHKDGASCGAECASHAHPSCVDTDVAAWRPNPYQEQTCPFSKNMQAAQCFLGPDSSPSLSKLKDPNLPDISMLSDKIMCNCENDSKKLCTRHEDSKHMKAIQVEKQYNPGLENVILKIKAENNYFKYIEGRLLKTISGNIAISFNTISILNTKFNKTKEFPVLLHKSDSDTLLIDIDQELINETTNATLRKTSNEKMLVVIADTMFNIDKDKINFEQNAKFYKMRIKGINNEVEPPVVLKLTPSDNYITVIDKEFEKKYRHTIGISIDENYKCTLVRSNSGNYEIALEDCSISQEAQNAFIVKSPSGNIKILVNGPDFEAITKRTSELSPDAVDCKSFDEILRKLLDKLPSSSPQLNKEKVKKSKFLGVKSSSETCLYEKVKFRLQNNQSLLTESSALLKRIMSGQYAVELNKESKKKIN